MIPTHLVVQVSEVLETDAKSTRLDNEDNHLYM